MRGCFPSLFLCSRRWTLDAVYYFLLSSLLVMTDNNSLRSLIMQYEKGMLTAAAAAAGVGGFLGTLDVEVYTVHTCGVLRR